MGPQLLIILGPTASGKTAASLQVAQRIPSEIVSADSRQLYRHLNIGTAKPTPEELRKVTHHCIDIREPDQKFNAGDFQLIAREAVAGILNRKKLPIVCGGTGLYLRALVDGFFDQPEFSGEIRKKLETRMEQEGKETLFNELLSIDPVSAKTMDPSKYRRVIRALEVYYETGIPISRFHAEHQKDHLYEARWIGLEWDRAVLYRRINERVDAMIAGGFLDEVKQLTESGFDDRFQSLQTVGYKEAFQFFKKEIEFNRMVELMKQNTRRFAKRQMTWFRKEPRIEWIRLTVEQELTSLAERIAADFRS